MDDVAGSAIGSLCARCHSFRLGRNVTLGGLSSRSESPPAPAMASRSARLAESIIRMMDVGRPNAMDYSVETCVPVASSAFLSVCQARVAHLTRTGNSQTPDNTASLPMSSGLALPLGPSVSIA
jgi:hypothetical protein